MYYSASIISSVAGGIYAKMIAQCSLYLHIIHIVDFVPCNDSHFFMLSAFDCQVCFPLKIGCCCFLPTTTKLSEAISFTSNFQLEVEKHSWQSVQTVDGVQCARVPILWRLINRASNGRLDSLGPRSFSGWPAAYVFFWNIWHPCVEGQIAQNNVTTKL